MTNAVQEKKTFYGWWLLGVIFVTGFVMGGLGLFTIAVFIPHLKEVFGGDLTIIGLGFVVWALCNGVTGPIAGVAIEKFGARIVMAVGVFVAASAWLVFVFMTTKAHLFLGMALSGSGLAACTFIPGQTLVTYWFDKYRGLALGLMAIGYGLGGMVLVPVANLVIAEYGWRTASGLTTVTMIAICVPLILIFVRTRPSDMGLLPDGRSPDDEVEENAAAAESGVSVRRAIGSGAFALIVLVLFFQVFGVSLFSIYFVAFAQSADFSDQLSANFWGLTAGIAALGNIIFGVAVDRYSPKVLLAGVGLLFVAAVVTLEVGVVRMGMTSALPLLIFALCHGLGMGGQGVLMPVLLAWCFGTRHFSKIIGWTAPPAGAAVAIAPLLGGYLYDETGSYEIVFIICFVGYIASIVLTVFISRKKLEPYFASDE